LGKQCNILNYKGCPEQKVSPIIEFLVSATKISIKEGSFFSGHPVQGLFINYSEAYMNQE